MPGKRNSASDLVKLKQIDELVDQIDTILDDLGVNDDDPEDAADGGADESTEAPMKAAPEVVADPVDAASLKALSLDKLVSAITDAINKLNDISSTRYDQWYSLAAAYDGYAIVRQGLGHYRVPYTVGDTAITLSDRADWQTVEPTWGIKGLPALHVADEPVAELSDPTPLIKASPSGRLRHYAVMWGDTDHRDVYREYFTPQTQELDVVFKAIGKLPLLYHHGLDKTLKTTVVGLVEEMGTDTVGLWVESQLDMANAYASGILRLARQQAVGTSSGTLPGSRRVKATGEVERWAIAEVSLTPSPAEPRMRTDVSISVLKAAYTELGLPIPDQLAADEGAAEARMHELALERERLSLLALQI